MANTNTKASFSYLTVTTQAFVNNGPKAVFESKSITKHDLKLQIIFKMSKRIIATIQLVKSYNYIFPDEFTKF